MKLKKKTPLSVLKTLEPFLNKTGSNFVSDESGKNLIRFIDKDPESDFYFNIEQYQTKNGFKVLIDYAPFHENSVENKRTWISGREINKPFSEWVTLLKAYEVVKSPYDDPIVESFKETYYTEFEIVEEEKNTPLHPQQILLLDEYFEKIETKIEDYITEDNAKQIEEIKEDISELRNNLSSKSKSWIADKVSWIWAKMTKLGPKLMKDFVNEGNKQIVREGVKQLIEIGKNLIG